MPSSVLLAPFSTVSAPTKASRFKSAVHEMLESPVQLDRCRRRRSGMTTEKVGRNDPCPCGKLRKYKQCCQGKVDWQLIIRNGLDWRKYVSLRGRNISFLNRLCEILQLQTNHPPDLKAYKAAFTAATVRRIHEAVMEFWPPDTDITTVLESDSAEVSGLYVGDYTLEYLSRGIVRHSTYANRILIVDPFIYPASVRDEFNPILEPEQFRAQTLRNVNLWFALMPWIEAGIVEVIRTPADFDPKLNWDSLQRQVKKFEKNPQLKDAKQISVEELQKRHSERLSRELMLAAPNDYLLQTARKLGLRTEGFEVEDFLSHVQAERDANPDFLCPIGPGGKGQIVQLSTGASYEIAKLTASIAGSYLVTDVHSKWREIELDRESQNVESRLWSPFAKALHESPLTYFNRVRLEHALKLRKEGRLESLRSFFLRVWKSARTEEPFDDVNAQLLAEELREEVAKAREEWRKIDMDLLKIVGGAVVGGLFAAGPLMAHGNASFLAAAVAAAGAAPLTVSTLTRKTFPDRFPAAFFMKIDDEK